MIDLSFLQFSRMSPRERMLRGLQGQLSPTFGLEVGAPRAQLGIIPMAGLGLWRPAPTVDATGVTVAPTVVQPESGGTYTPGSTPTATVYTAPTTTYATVAVQAPTIREAPTYTPPTATVANQPTAPAIIMPDAAPADAPPSENPPMVDPSIQSDARDDYDPNSYASGTADDTQVDQYGDYDPDGNTQDAWGEESSGGGGTSPGARSDVVYDHDTMANQGAIKKVATKTEAMVQSAKGTVAQYWPWILGGGVLLGAAFLMGRRK